MVFFVPPPRRFRAGEADTEEKKEEKKKMLMMPKKSLATALVGGALAAAAIPARAADTQGFTPARYVIVAAEVNVALIQNDANGGAGTRKVLLKMDTQTGEVWILQLGIFGGNDPRVTAASWCPVRMTVPAPRRRIE